MAKEKMKMVSLYLPQDQIDSLKNIAEYTHDDFSNVIRKAIKARLFVHMIDNTPDYDIVPDTVLLSTIRNLYK